MLENIAVMLNKQAGADNVLPPKPSFFIATNEATGEAKNYKLSNLKKNKSKTLLFAIFTCKISIITLLLQKRAYFFGECLKNCRRLLNIHLF